MGFVECELIWSFGVQPFDIHSDPIGTFAPDLQQPVSIVSTVSFGAKLKEVVALFKLRLTSLVVFSAVLGYWMGVPAGGFDLMNAAMLSIAGLLVTGIVGGQEGHFLTIKALAMRSTRFWK